MELILLIKVRMSAIVGILTFISREIRIYIYRALKQDCESLLFSILVSIMPRLHLPYEEYTIPKSPFPCGLRRETLRPSYGFTGIVASLRFCLTPQNDKLEKKS